MVKVPRKNRDHAIFLQDAEANRFSSMNPTGLSDSANTKDETN